MFHLEQDAGNQGTSITLPLDKKVGPSIDYYSATKACQLLFESNYEASADEETSAHYTSSSDTEFDLSDPDAGMDDATYCDTITQKLVKQVLLSCTRPVMVRNQVTSQLSHQEVEHLYS